MMLAELLHTVTSDGLRLDGALHRPAAGESSKLAIDAVLCLPGVGANFYGSTMLEILSRPLLAAGAAVLWANTRGHDLVYTAATPSGIRRMGAAYETVDDCRHDLAAWCSLLAGQGYRRIGLIGHSLGAVKCAYAAAQTRDLPVERLVAISPPRLCYSRFKQAGIEAFLDAITLCESKVAAGTGDELVEVGFPFPLLITAASYVDKYGRGERYDIARFAARLPCAALFVYGGDELARGGVPFAEADQLIESLAADSPQRLEVQVVAGADHFYSGERPQLAHRVADWLKQ